MKYVLSLLLALFILTGNSFAAKDKTFSSIVVKRKTPVQQNRNPIIKQKGKKKTSSFIIDSIDPLLLKNGVPIPYPGARGANQLVIYTPKYGIRTGTNEFGKEAIVENGRVIRLSPSDSFIPSNGFVISGHGIAKNWIEKNITVGARINIDTENNILTAIIEDASFIFEAESNYNEINRTLSAIKKTYAQYDFSRTDKFLLKAQEYLQKAKECEQTNPDRAKSYAKDAIIYTNNALVYALPAKTNEFKGIWIRPTETSKSQICNTLNKIQEAGIDNVFLEAFYHGMTIYPSRVMQNYGLIRVNPKFPHDEDLMEIWVEEAHKRNMKLHAWFQAFYVGNAPINSSPKHILAIYPNWANIQKQYVASSSIVPCASEHSGFFLDPANPEVQKFLVSVLAELVTKYEVDGINLDYIRYPRSSPSDYFGYAQTNWGYSTYARGEFQKLYGVDPVTLDSSSPMWSRWVAYRQGKITDFILKARAVKNKKNNLLLSAVIFPDRSQAEIEKLQKWSLWASNGYLDALTPLIMTSGENLTKNYISTIKNYSRNRTKIYPGIFQPFSNSSYIDMLTQIKTLREAKADGIIIFDYAHMNQTYSKALKARVFSDY